MSKNGQKSPVFAKNSNIENYKILYIALIHIYIIEENLRDMYKKMKI
jgi:hypothetical protein